MPNRIKIKTKDISDVSSEVIESKAFIATEHIEKVSKLAEKINAFDFSVGFYPIEYVNEEEVFIPTGTSDRPKGITESKDDIVAFIKVSDGKSFPHMFHRCISMKELKNEIKHNWSKIEKKIEESGDFKTLGVVVRLV